ncbi:beta-N-acetylhexosaminidase [Cellvibrio sp. UBA7661]|uniref:beta-N-acetylhexosaminidase n=1 Tax=Cellvibrio sp. UBA7661 TaxID=1946311 RepID=UPI002F35D431
MKRCLLFIVVALFPLLATANSGQLALVPYPQSVVEQQGQLVMNEQWLFAADGKVTKDLNVTLDLFADRVKAQTGKTIRWKKTSEKKSRVLIRIKNAAPLSSSVAQWDESYQLTVNADRIELSAAQLAGAQRGLETLLQLIGTNGQLAIPLVTINDFPRFKWRGLLLDTSRHFFSVDTIKRQIDAMAVAKYNIFHWHLTDDQGWRFESKRYPKLHTLASDGEYYTRAQMRDVVAYARARGIQVLPEIDMPGHASAIAVAYPELMSAPGPYAMEYRWGVHKPTLNPANENVYKFADAIFKEVADIFPFEYIHIGGDEVDPEHWNTNPSIQAFMKAEGLKNHRALQAYFNQRLQALLEKHQRKMIGWDEIQHPDLPNNIVIHSWRGPDGVSDAVSHGFQSVLSTGYYLDQPQAAAYHYRNDPIPSAPVVIENISANETITTWRFEMPRKRGKPVTGTFTLIKSRSGDKNIGSDEKTIHGVIDFTGKSRRDVLLKNISDAGARFSVDTWMGPVEFYVNFLGNKLQGRALVGNTPYSVSGEKVVTDVAQKQLPKTESVAHLGAQQEALVLGGEAALWAEIVNEQSIDVRLWPRAFVVAERLWSARELQDENSMYVRVNSIALLAEKSVGLQHRLQQDRALQTLAGKNNIAPVKIFAELLEPAHYYHRQHEKSAYETYSKQDPLNRLVDALPAENENLRQFNQRLSRWLANPQNNADYAALNAQLQLWKNNLDNLKPVLLLNPQWQSLVEKSNSVVDSSMRLLALRMSGAGLSAAERAQVEALIWQARTLDQELVIAAAVSLELILDSFTTF